MGNTSKIEWTDKTWNPIRGCSMVSAGCANCYAMKQAHRFSGMGRPYENLTEVGPKGPRWNGNIRMVPGELKAPMTWKNPCRVFVNSMSDLFHDDVPDSFIDQVMQAMANTKRHTYQVLTKRPERMMDYLAGWWRRCYRSFETGESIPVDPCPHIWFGVSVENQETADERITLLLQTPAAVKFLSCEPLLGPIDLAMALEPFHSHDPMLNRNVAPVQWAIVGGESGPGARPCDVAWIRSIKDQCKAADVPVFIKQLGAKPYQSPEDDGGTGYELSMKDRKGGDWNEWPEDLRVREFPTKGARHE